MIQFRDLNPDVNAFQRNFVREVRRCDEIERKIRFLHTQLEKAKMPPSRLEVPEGHVKPKTIQEIDELDERLTVFEEEVRRRRGAWASRRGERLTHPGAAANGVLCGAARAA